MKDGYVLKNKYNTQVSDAELELINKFTRRKLAAEEIYVFSVVLCDNDIDRENERFTNNALEKLSEMYIGKTGVLDHNLSSENQTARVFSCQVEEVPGKLNRIKMPYRRLLARAYMPRSQKNEDTILSIDSGITKEVSVGCAVGSITCSICAQEIKADNCPHVKGKRYKKDGNTLLCHAVLDNPTDAYEWSFVAVPSQREAGVIKAFNPTLNGGEIKMEDIIKKLETGEPTAFDKNQTEKLFELIKDLKEKANIGNIYHEKLKSEVLRLSGIVQPEVDIEVMKHVIQKMSLEELKVFKSSFKTKLSKVIPCAPQIGMGKKETKSMEYSQFKI